MKEHKRGVALLFILCAFWPIGCGSPQNGLTVTSSAFGEGKAIPIRYTGDGEDVSPPIAWSGVPAGTKSLALICDDPDAPSDEPWSHWVIGNIPAALNALPENIEKSVKPKNVEGAIQGKNDFPKTGYNGPMPPENSGVHRYHFAVYAIDGALDLSEGTTRSGLLKAMQGHILAEGELIGTYERK